MKSTLTISLSLLFALLLSACSGNSAPLKEIAQTYAEIADNNQQMIDAIQDAYKASGAQQQALSEKANSLAESVKTKNQQLTEKAKSLAEKLQGSEIACEVSPNLNIKIDKAIFEKIGVDDRGAAFTLTGQLNEKPSEQIYYFLLDNDNNIITRNGVSCHDDGSLLFSFRFTAADAYKFVNASKIRFVPLNEFINNTISQSTNEKTANFDELKLEKGANLVNTLKSAKNVTYEYNADS